MNNDFNAQAINRFKKGDKKVFEEIYKTYFEQLFNFVYYYLKDEQLSENVVQDVFFQLWKNRDKLKSNVNLKSYLFTANKNRALNVKRHQKIQQDYVDMKLYLPDSVELPDETLQFKELKIAIDQAIQSLPEKRRIIFMMHRFDKYTYNQIAERLNISVKTVETQIRRSLVFLDKKLSHFL